MTTLPASSRYSIFVFHNQRIRALIWGTGIMMACSVDDRFQGDSSNSNTYMSHVYDGATSEIGNIPRSGAACTLETRHALPCPYEISTPLSDPSHDTACIVA